MNNILSMQDEDFLEDIKDLSEDKKNSIIAYVKDKVESTKESIGVFVEEITVSPNNLFTGKVVKSGNGASISFKKKFVGREVYIIVKESKNKCKDCNGKGYHESYNQVCLCDCIEGKDD